MKFRSFNEELLISTALLVNVFNDIIIDRRSHGLKRDYSKAISFDEIVQKKIEIPCIVGDRSNILRSLENEQGKYKLPLIILQNKSIKTDTTRMVDLHADVFYQTDNRFAELNPEDPLYKPQQLAKRRGQPTIMEFDMTIITKYKEDMDQILSNWIVHFRPDVYVKWWHPRIKTSPLTSQILWGHNVSFDSPVEYNPTNIFTYKSTTSFSFKTWLFPGMNFIEQDTINEPIIKHIKFYPNKSEVWDEEDIERGYKDINDNDTSWLFGDLEEEEPVEEPTQEPIEEPVEEPVEEPTQEPIEEPVEEPTQEPIEEPIEEPVEEPTQKPIEEPVEEPIEEPMEEKPKNEFIDENEGQLAFWGVRHDQEFYNDGSDEAGLKAGKYMVNNVFAKNYPAISGDPVLSQIHKNPLYGDIFRKSDRLALISNQWTKFQYYLNTENSLNDGNAIINNVYYKGGFPEEYLKMNPPSGDYLLNKFCRTYIKNKGTADEKTLSSEFGQSIKYLMPMHLNYEILSKDLTLSTEYHDTRINVTASSIYNSQKGIVQDFELISNPFNRKIIKMHLGCAVDKNFKDLYDKSIKELKNISLFNTRGIRYDVQFKVQDYQVKNIMNKIINFINVYKNAIELREIDVARFEMIIEDSKAGKILQDKDLKDVNFKTFTMPHQQFLNGYYYQILLNKYVYIVLKQNAEKEDDVDIYDVGSLVPLTFSYLHAPVYEITIPESKMLLGLGFYMGI